jgi:2-polyprenyl-3-methyl-5-hydroxy-6-metoxy-1,4-benzoquinol methylase
MFSLQSLPAAQPAGQIRSCQRPNCYLCAAGGQLLYEALTDRLYGAPGIWNFRRCSNAECGLIWLDPMPLEEDIGNAYTSYHTHSGDAQYRRKNRTEVLDKILRGAYELFLRVTPLFAEREGLRLMYLANLQPGKVLDVGCGNGSRLVRFRALGWEVDGQEVDPEAAGEAQRISGAPVYLGRLEQAQFPDRFFDVVTMSHVIEHVYDPVALLQECRRILKPSGFLIITTPNADSYGHDQFGACWRGLEPPRHLHLFSRRTLNHAATRAGFSRCETWTSTANATGFAMGSYGTVASALGKGQWPARLNLRMMAAVYQFRAFLAHRRAPLTGEECVLKAAP